VLGVLERIAPRLSGSLERRTRWPTNLFLTFLNLVALGVVPVSLLKSRSTFAGNGRIDCSIAPISGRVDDDGTPRGSRPSTA
jgi:hypothetical protein